jgi:hypothetical protein
VVLGLVLSLPEDVYTTVVCPWAQDRHPADLHMPGNTVQRSLCMKCRLCHRTHGGYMMPFNQWCNCSLTCLVIYVCLVGHEQGPVVSYNGSQLLMLFSASEQKIYCKGCMT